MAIIMYAVIFGGEHWIPENDSRYENPNNPGFVFPGRLYDWDMSPLYKEKAKIWGPSRHFTNVFNIFVLT